MIAASRRKRARLLMLLAGLAGVGLAAWLMITAFRDNIVFFFTPTEMKEKSLAVGTRVRAGGLVEAGSVARTGGQVAFVVTDGATRLLVQYDGILPDLFREGQGIVADGVWQGEKDGIGQFQAETVLAKHDENYMPPELAEALKKTGRWKDGDKTQSNTTP